MAISWQKYQEAVGLFYTGVEKLGDIQLNIHIPDKVTGQPRQVDAWCELKLGDHIVKVLIDAKYRAGKIDIKDLEEVEALAKAVKADKAIIVTNNGWTKPSIKRAEFSSIDLRILSVEQALNLTIKDKWMMCQSCKDECVVMDSDGVMYQTDTELFFDWYAGKCRECKDMYLHCPGCGNRVILEDGDEHKCSCPNEWKREGDELLLKLGGVDNFQRIDHLPKAPSEFVFWLLRYPREYWARISFQILQVPTVEGDTFSFMINPDNGEMMKPDYEDDNGPTFFFPIS